jgi:predicted dienelactone hydrolase
MTRSNDSRRALRGARQPITGSFNLVALLLIAVVVILTLAACGGDDEGGAPAPTTAQLPTQPGPFGVGVRQMTFTRKSTTMPTQDRALLTDIWYPTAPNAGPTDPELGGIVNAPWAAGAANLPVVVFSHGHCCVPQMSRFFMRAVASHGFIVAAPLHTGNLFTDPNCPSDSAAQQDSYANRPPDIMFVIDSLLQLNADSTSFFSGAINPNRIGLSGHSFGGHTALRVSAVDPRVIAGLALAPGAPLLSVLTNIHIPMMVQGGADDRATAFDLLVQPIYNHLNPPKYLVKISHTGHTAFFDDLCYPTVPTTSAPTPWCDAGGPDALTADAAHQFILRYAVPFLLRWVAGDNRFDAFLALDAAPPGVIFTADIGEPNA